MGNPSIPPIPARATLEEGNFRKVKASFQDGILEEYGSVKFSEIGDKDPLVYAYSRRPKAILQAKALRHLDNSLGLAPHVHASKTTPSTKERRKRANRLAYENGVIGNKAVQQCIRDLFIGYNIRYASQEFKLGRIQKANAQLEQRITELMNNRRCTGSTQSGKIGPAQNSPNDIDTSKQAFGQDHYTVQESIAPEMKLGVGHHRESRSFPYQNAYPTERNPARPSGSDHTHEINHLTLQRGANCSIIPYDHQILFSPQNRPYQQQKTYPLNSRQAGGSQSHHPHLSQHKHTHQQEISSMENHRAFFSLSQPHHTPLNQQGGIQRDLLPINQWPQCFFPQDQIPIIPQPCSNNQDQHGRNQIIDLGRQSGLFPVIGHDLHPEICAELGQHVSIAQNMNGDGSCMTLAESPDLQNGHNQKVESKWNASMPILCSEATSPSFHLES